VAFFFVGPTLLAHSCVVCRAPPSLMPTSSRLGALGGQASCLPGTAPCPVPNHQMHECSEAKTFKGAYCRVGSHHGMSDGLGVNSPRSSHHRCDEGFLWAPHPCIDPSFDTCMQDLHIINHFSVPSVLSSLVLSYPVPSPVQSVLSRPIPSCPVP
jgi:hypothetical protein